MLSDWIKREPDMNIWDSEDNRYSIHVSGPFSNGVILTITKGSDYPFVEKEFNCGDHKREMKDALSFANSWMRGH